VEREVVPAGRGGSEDGGRPPKVKPSPSLGLALPFTFAVGMSETGASGPSSSSLSDMVGCGAAPGRGKKIERLRECRRWCRPDVARVATGDLEGAGGKPLPIAPGVECEGERPFGERPLASEGGGEGIEIPICEGAVEEEEIEAGRFCDACPFPFKCDRVRACPPLRSPRENEVASGEGDVGA
jgi:hypothetical protein